MMDSRKGVGVVAAWNAGSAKNRYAIDRPADAHGVQSPNTDPGMFRMNENQMKG
jgi:hypothetical protein